MSSEDVNTSVFSGQEGRRIKEHGRKTNQVGRASLDDTYQIVAPSLLA